MDHPTYYGTDHKTKEELEAMGLSSTSEIDVESVRNTVRTLNESTKTIEQLRTQLAAAEQVRETQSDEIERLQNLLVDTLTDIAKTGANYDTFNPLRARWEVLRKELAKVQS